METKSRATGLVVGLMTGVTIFWTIPHLISNQREKDLEGFVQPSQVKMKVTDLNRDGIKESIYTYNRKDYLQKFNEKTNMVSLIPYDLEIKENREAK